MFNTVEDVQEIYRHRHLLDRLELFYNNANAILPRSLIGIKNEEWKRHARIVEPLLKRSALTQYLDQILKYTDDLIEIWTRRTDNNKLQTEIIDQCQQLLLKIMLSISYGEENNKHLMNIISECNSFSTWSIFNGLHISLIRFYVNYVNPKYYYARRQLRNLINISPTNNEQPKTFLKSLVESSLSPDELLDEILMINTGVDGVSTTLSWFIYYMSKYPNVQEKIKLELRQHSARLTNEVIDQLQYVDLVIKEIFRHSPIADITMRTIVSQGDNNIQINGINLRPGDSIGIAVSNIHHDQRYWKIDPSLFYPERFLEDDRDHSAYAYLPFGIGHYRACPGKHLALYQLKVICVRLMQMVTFIDADCQNQNVAVETKGGDFVGLKNLTVYVKHDKDNGKFNNK
jgi:cytochrome P450